MKTIDDILKNKNINPTYLKTEEQKCLNALSSSQFGKIIKLFDCFTALFSDDINNHCNRLTNNDIKILFFHECFKRLHLAIEMNKRGYFIESIGLLRTAFELNKTINAMNKGIITPIEFFGQARGPEFAALSEDEKQSIIEQYQKSIMSKVDTFDDQAVPDTIKPNLRIFKKNMHNSVHRAFNNLITEVSEFNNGTFSHLFAPDTKVSNYESSVNYLSFLILMFLRNWRNSEFFKDDGQNTIQDIIEFIENSYSSMGKQVHSDVINYIQTKY